MTEEPQKNDAEMTMSKKQYRMTMLMILGLGLIWALFNQLTDRNTKETSPAPATASVPATVQTHNEYRSYPIMGTMAEVSLYGSEKTTVQAADTVYNTFKEVETVANIFNPQSELSRLNSTADSQPFQCEPLLWDILQHARRAWKLSGGSFDVTARPLMVMWGFYVKERKGLPAEAERLKALANVGLDKVVFDDTAHTVRFLQKGISIDLGGIAKGYAVDLAVGRIKAMGINQGVVNLAGNMYCFPAPPPGKTAYNIGIRDPLDKNSGCGMVSVVNTSLATSGNYERYVTIDGRQYTHIMNVKTGMPVENMLAVTVVTPQAVDADLLSTSIFINGEDFARRICREIPGTSVLLIRPGKEYPEVIKIGDIWGEIKL